MVMVAPMFTSWPDWGLMPVEAFATTVQPSKNSSLILMPKPVCDRLLGAIRNRELLPLRLTSDSPS